MKIKKVCVMIVIAMGFTVSLNAIADCGSCEEAKPASCEKVKSSSCGEAKSAKCSKQKSDQKAAKATQVKKLKDGDIPLAQVPEKIKKIARKAVKGLQFTEAEIDDGNYELEGYVDGVKYEVEITPEGKVVKIEKKNTESDNEEVFDS